MSPSRPNVLFLLNDHQAYYGHGLRGGAAPARPCFDRLASGGVVFDRAYSVSPLCTPVRRSMITGLMPHNHGFLTLYLKENAQERDHGILYDLLAARGYDLYYFGKWHTGPGTARDYGCKGFCHPDFGNPYITPEYAQYVKERELPPASFDLEHVLLEPVSPDRPRPGPGYRCEAPHLHPHVTGVMETPAETHESFFLANLAVDALREIAARPRRAPFCMSVHFDGPHAPYLAAPE